MLSDDDGPAANGRFRPCYSQLYIWQTPLLLLNSSVYLFIAGLAVLLWNASKLQGYKWERDETKVGIQDLHVPFGTTLIDEMTL